MRNLIVAFVFILAGCATSPDYWQSADAGPKPDNARALAEQMIREQMKDPAATQFQNWSELYKTWDNVYSREPVWALCVDANGKNSYGGYTGFKPWSVRFRDGQPIFGSAQPEPVGCQGLASDPARR